MCWDFRVLLRLPTWIRIYWDFSKNIQISFENRLFSIKFKLKQRRAFSQRSLHLVNASQFEFQLGASASIWRHAELSCLRFSVSSPACSKHLNTLCRPVRASAARVIVLLLSFQITRRNQFSWLIRNVLNKPHVAFFNRNRL